MGEKQTKATKHIETDIEDNLMAQMSPKLYNSKRNGML